MNEARGCFNLIKIKITRAFVLVLPKFNEVYEVEDDVVNLGIGTIHSQESKPPTLQ